ncbi:MFS general substrate transporter [Xylona heveae TC161]|uniref:MFS general substrate transporter n=1 Tax=Xylona heveae (strain CBS 132557 / TC161) TaxID=1328760 RepID=A0A165K389_XYLHT|nr:MFS general substrate transporter [Xylona heveae TC161]KZF26936.1 MFS general substrate transporter [Xylona heveae TC161]
MPQATNMQSEKSEQWNEGSTTTVLTELTFETPMPQPFPPSSLYPSPPPKLISPFDWTSRRKIFTTCLSCTVTVVSGYASGSNNAPGPVMGAAWDVSQTLLTLGTTTYCIGFAIAPMILAPFSEIKGREPVFLFSGLIFFLSQLGCALTDSFSGLLIARFFAGVGSSTFSTMVGGIVADIYRVDERNTAMAIFAGAAFFGTGLGPLVSGIIAFHLQWRWVFYVQAISCGSLTLISAIFFQETRENVLLSRNARALNQWYAKCQTLGMRGLNVDGQLQQVQWSIATKEDSVSLASLLRISLSRPLRLLVTEPVVFWFSLWIAFAWGVLYLSFGGLPLTFKAAYGFNSQQIGAVFTSMAVGALLGATVNIYLERLRPRLGNPIMSPESRLHFACLECFMFPTGLFIWAWTCRESIHWIVPSIAIAIATIGIYTIFLAVNNYTADTYHRYASSALAAQSLTRNILGGVFPLATDAMFSSMKIPGALSFLGGVALILSVVPWALLIYGPRIRARSKIANEIH